MLRWLATFVCLFGGDLGFNQSKKCWLLFPGVRIAKCTRMPIARGLSASALLIVQLRKVVMVCLPSCVGGREVAVRALGWVGDCAMRGQFARQRQSKCVLLFGAFFRHRTSCHAAKMARLRLVSRFGRHMMVGALQPKRNPDLGRSERSARTFGSQVATQRAQACYLRPRCAVFPAGWASWGPSCFGLVSGRGVRCVRESAPSNGRLWLPTRQLVCLWGACPRLCCAHVVAPATMRPQIRAHKATPFRTPKGLPLKAARRWWPPRMARAGRALVRRPGLTALLGRASVIG